MKEIIIKYGLWVIIFLWLVSFMLGSIMLHMAGVKDGLRYCAEAQKSK